jgi:hypothetical protein
MILTLDIKINKKPLIEIQVIKPLLTSVLKYRCVVIKIYFTPLLENKVGFIKDGNW